MEKLVIDGKISSLKRKKSLSSFSMQVVQPEVVAAYQANAEAVLYEEEQPIEYQLTKIQAKRRCLSAGMLATDVFLLIWDHITLLALLLGAGLRWTWPNFCVQAVYWILAFNLDIYNFVKISSGAYVSVQNGITDSNIVPFSFLHQFLIFVLLLALLFGSLSIASLYVHYFGSVHRRLHLAHIRRAGIILAQVVALPLAAFIGRLFHCNSSNQQFTGDNSVTCWTGNHWFYLFPALLVGLPFFVIPPIWLIRRGYLETVSTSSSRREVYLQLKELEYRQGLDLLWELRDYHIFSSFSAKATHFRAVWHLSKLLLMIIYAAFYNNIIVQATLFAVFFFLATLSVIFIKPFRLHSFNVYLFINWFALFLDSVIGALRASFTSYSTRSVFLTDSYCTCILSIIEGMWLLSTLCFLLYILIAENRQRGLWRRMEEWHYQKKMKPESRRYVRSLLRARALYEQCTDCVALLAPVHELARHILLLNALRAEAEWLQDPLADSLWTALDDMMETHARLAPMSLFAYSVKPSIRSTAAELMRLAPDLARRMHQREYDLLLVAPVRRRLLFKMYCLALLMRGIRECRARKEFHSQQEAPLWNSKLLPPRRHEDDDYFEQLYPSAEEENLHVLKPLMSAAELYDLSMKNVAQPLSMEMFGSVACLLDWEEELEENDEKTVTIGSDESLSNSYDATKGILNNGFEDGNLSEHE